ncbi:MAG: AI-2E family transporter [Pseudomonadota bacterium]
MRRIGRHLATGPFFTLAFVALTVFCLWATRDYVVPIALAFLVWFLINGLTDAVMRSPFIGAHLPRWMARAAAASLLFLAIALAVRVVSTNLADLAEGVNVDQNPLLLRAWLWLASLGLTEHLTREALIARLAGDGLLGAALETVRGFLSDVVLVFLYTIFLLVDERFYEPKLRALWPDEAQRARIRAVLAEIGRETRAYLWLMTLISAGVGLTTWALCAAFGLKGAGLWGFLAFGLNYIPTIGSILAVVLPAAFAALTLADPALILALTALLGLTQFVAGEIVIPRLMGDRLNLSTLVIILALVGWGAVWGPAGMFLALPITVIMTMIFAKFEATRPIAIVLSRTGYLPSSEAAPVPAPPAPASAREPR